MTRSGMTKADYDELMARAVELEAPIPGLPTENPAPPCNLVMIQTAAQDLGAVADKVRARSKDGERERARLAQSLRNAAKAYEETDEGAGEAITNETSVSRVTVKGAELDEGPTHDDTPHVTAVYDPDAYFPVEDAAQQISQPDQGASLTDFANKWDAYKQTLRDAWTRFRSFDQWWSQASAAAEASLSAQESWLDSMAEICGQMAFQARAIVSAHKWAVSQHPTVAAVTEVNTNYNYRKPVGFQCPGYTKKPPLEDDICNGRFNCGSDVLWVRVINSCNWKDKDENYNNGKKNLEKRHADMQAKSESTIKEYATRAGLTAPGVRLPPLSPQKPPSAYHIPDPSDNPIDPDNPFDPFNPNIPDINPYNPDLSDRTGMPSIPSMPSAPSMPTTPNDAGEKEKAALMDALKKGAPGGPLKGAPGLKPASLGGGGGMPSTPLQPAMDAGAATAPAGAGPGAAGLGRGMPGAGGAMGGGMGGGMPMGGAAGQGQNQGKGKRVQSDDEESLYTEEREWTEGVIGNRPRKAGPDK